MSKKLYVGNLAHELSSAELRSVFEPYGTVDSAQVIMDRDTGRSKGFGFVEMAEDKEAQDAIKALDGKEVSGRAIKVNEARPREERSGGSGRGGFGGGRNNFGGGGGGYRDRNGSGGGRGGFGGGRY